MLLSGKGVLITGASAGLGKAVARACLREGAYVYICARDKDALESTRGELLDEVGEPRVFAMQADVSDPAAVQGLVAAVSRELPNLSGLVNNAGVQGPKGLLENADTTEWLRAVEINLFGTMLCCRAVLPIFRRAGYGKIVNLSGGGAAAPRPRMSAYAASKAAVVRLTETIAEEYAEYKIDVNAIAPGALNTRMLDEIIAAGPDQVGETAYAQAVKQKREGGASPDRAANLCTFLLSRNSDRLTGKLLSAVWDPWESLASRLTDLEKSDVYTLRRVTPKDRGLDW